MKKVALFISLAILAGSLHAEVVRPTPEFSWIDSTGAVKSFKAFRGHPVVLLIANSPRQWAFRSQVGQLQKMYQRLAADKIICVAAFSKQPGIVRSNIPFVLAADGPRVAFNYEAPQGFAIAIIGRDGNLDYFGHTVLPVQRVYDILNNSYAVQRALRSP